MCALNEQSYTTSLALVANHLCKPATPKSGIRTHKTANAQNLIYNQLNLQHMAKPTLQICIPSVHVKNGSVCKQRLHLFNTHQPLQHKQFLQVCRQRVHSSCVAKARFCNVCNTKSAHVQTMPIYEPSPHMLLPKFFNCCTLEFKMYTSCFAKWRTKRANVYTHIAQSANQVCPSAQTLLYEDRTAKLTSQVCSCAK